jgi:RTX calcium-binding nonapeptide repeat (4 copies)
MKDTRSRGVRAAVAAAALMTGALALSSPASADPGGPLPQASATPIAQATVTGPVGPYVPPPATCFGRTVTLVVPPGGADFYGSSDPSVVDVIQGSSGDDRIFAQAGNDFVCGGGGYDYVEGGPGADWLDGEGGTDILYGGNGNDVVYGGQGSDWDVVLGDGGNDLVFGQGGDDQLACDDPTPGANNGTSDVADGGPGAGDYVIGSGCESMPNVEYW